MIAATHNLRVFEKDKRVMSDLAGGHAAFFIALYFEGDAIMYLTNVGIGDKIILASFDHGKMEIRRLDEITKEISAGAKSLDLTFIKVQSW